MSSRTLYKETRVAKLHHHHSPLQSPFHIFHFNTPSSKFWRCIAGFPRTLRHFHSWHLFHFCPPSYSFLKPLLMPSLEAWHLAHPCFKSGCKPWRLSFTRARCQCRCRCYATASRGKRGVPSMPTHFHYLHTSVSARLSCCG